jgi:acyl-CoA synthetase (AMP-forming)/AMP-acid ligase II
MHEISRTIARTLASPAEGGALAYRGHWRSWQWLSEAARAIDRAVGEVPAVGIVARNRPHHIAAYAANLAAGRATAMLYAAQTAVGLAADIERIRLPAIVADAEDWSPQALAAAATAGTAAIATSDRGDDVAVTILREGTPSTSFRALADTVALELLSSGTTGLPKRLPLSWDAIGHVVASSATAYAGSGVPAPQIMVHPLGNVAGLAYATPPLASVTPLVLLDRFEVWPWAEAVRDYHPTRGTIPPVGIGMLLDSQVPREWLASLTLIAVGGARLNITHQIAFEERFGIPLLTAYGATEFGGVIANWSLPDYREWGPRKRGSAGRPSPGASIRIVDPADGRTMAYAEAGILEAQVERIGPAWIRTNDLASIDSDGFLFLHGRADDAINRGGFKIVPEVVAAALRAHPAIADAAVVGLADARLGEVPVAAVELAPEAQASPEELRTWLKDRLVAYQLPVDIRIVDALPRNASLKVSLADVRALFA